MNVRFQEKEEVLLYCLISLIRLHCFTWLNSSVKFEFGVFVQNPGISTSTPKEHLILSAGVGTVEVIKYYLYIPKNGRKKNSKIVSWLIIGAFRDFSDKIYFFFFACGYSNCNFVAFALSPKGTTLRRH